MTTAIAEPETTLPEMPEDSEVRFNRDGSVRRKPGPKPGTRRTRTAPAPPRRPAATARKASEPDYRPALLGLAQVPQLLLGMVARLTGKNAFALDAMTVGLHAPALAHAVNETAKSQPNVAAMCERLAAVGPYGLIVTAASGVIAQMLCNHGVIPANDATGLLSPEGLVERAAEMVAGT